ncbi:MAG: hypothetical protein NZM37_10740 [Sandaracinaceae bacterium]|nr:hypothetical protein [Sandaracinaceae bacterium]
MDSKTGFFFCFEGFREVDSLREEPEEDFFFEVRVVFPSFEARGLASTGMPSPSEGLFLFEELLEDLDALPALALVIDRLPHYL